MVLVILAGVPGAWLATSIRTQRAAIAAIEAAGGAIGFDYQAQPVAAGAKGWPRFRTEPAAPRWLRRVLGDELFRSVRSVFFAKEIGPEALAAVGRCDLLENLYLFGAIAPEAEAQLGHLRGLGRLRELTVGFPAIGDAALAEIGRLASLRKLDLLAIEASDEGLAHLARLPNLTELTLQDNRNFADAGRARMLAGMPQLRSFALSGQTPPVTATLAALARHHPDLRELRIDRCGVTDADLAPIAGLTRLSRLHLTHTRITDAGLAHLAPLRDLVDLNLQTSRITGAGLAHLGGLTRLKTLNLTTTRVTDAGLPHLASLVALEDLTLDATGVTDAGLPPLLARLPRLASLSLAEIPTLTDAGLAPARLGPALRFLTLSRSAVTPGAVAALASSRPGLRLTNNLAATPIPRIFLDRP